MNGVYQSSNEKVMYLRSPAPVAPDKGEKMKRLLTGLIMFVCFAGSTSYAQGQDNQTDASTVNDTIAKVHTAISSLDISKMELLCFTMPTSCWLIQKTRACQLVGMM